MARQRSLKRRGAPGEVECGICDEVIERQSDTHAGELFEILLRFDEDGKIQNVPVHAGCKAGLVVDELLVEVEERGDPDDPASLLIRALQERFSGG